MEQIQTDAPVMSWWASLTARSEFTRDRVVPILRYLRRNRLMIIGLGAFIALALFVGLSYLFYEQEDLLQQKHGVSGLVKAASVQANQKPSWNPWSGYPLGTDVQGRDIYAAVVVGIPLSLRIGLIAAAIGVGVGMVLAFVAAYVGGAVDAVIRTIVDSLIPIPGLLVLVLVATSLNPGQGLTVDQLAFVIAVLAWPGPARVIRSQVLVIRERGYVEMARMSGTSPSRHHIQGNDAEPSPLRSGKFRRRGLGIHTRVHRPRIPGIRPARLPNTRQHDLLEHLHQLRPPRAVVLALATHHSPRRPLRRPIHDLGRSGRGCQSAITAEGVSKATTLTRKNSFVVKLSLFDTA